MTAPLISPVIPAGSRPARPGRGIPGRPWASSALPLARPARPGHGGVPTAARKESVAMLHVSAATRGGIVDRTTAWRGWLARFAGCPVSVAWMPGIVRFRWPVSPVDEIVG